MQPRHVALVSIFCLAAAAAGRAGPLDLYVSSDALNKTTMYNGVTGAQLVDPFTVTSANTMGPLGLQFSPDGSRMLVGHFLGGLDEFDAATGGYIKTYNAGAADMNWAGVYAPNGQVYAGDSVTDTVRRYDPNTGAFLGIFAPVPEPADMKIGPNGNLYVCSFAPGAGVFEFDVLTGAPISNWPVPNLAQANDIEFLPNGEFLVTTMKRTNPADDCVWRFDAAHNLIGSFAGTGWGRPHGIRISPHDGNIYVVDGVTTQVHVFDSSTFVELDPAFLNPFPLQKTVDLDFRPVPEPAGALLIAVATLVGLRRR